MRINSADHPGMKIIDRLKEPIYEKWREMRTLEGGGDLAVFIFEKSERELAVMMGPRDGVIEGLTREGVDFTKFPEIQKPASENNPFPAIGIWVIVGLESDDTSEKRVAITRFIEPVLGRLGGVTMGSA